MTKAGNSRIMRTITLLITIFSLSLSAYAQYSGGTGEPNDPYLIYTAEHMNEIGLHEEDWDKHFTLVTDVDLSDYPGTLFNKIGVYVKAGSSENRPFTGKFDGQDHTIRHFTWTPLEGKHSTTGLFVHLGSLGIIENLRLEHIDVNVPEGGRIGGLVGYNIEGEIRNCSVTGRVTSWQGNYIGGLVGENYRGSISICSAVVDVSGVSYVGGLVGKSAHGEISKSHAHGQVQGGSYIGGLIGQIAAHGPVSDCNATGEVFANGGYVGGLIGYVDGYGTISGCNATGSVFAGSNCVGGLVGRVSGQTEISYSYAIGDVHTDARYAGGLLGYGGGSIDNAYYIGSISAGGDYVGGLVGLYKGTISNTYAQGSVSYPGEHVGGLVGKNEGTIMNCYAVVESSRLKNRGGLVRTNNGLVVDSFWDKEASGVSYSDAGEGKTTMAMMDPNTFIPWACSVPGIWTIDAHRDYPRLAWEGLPGEAIAPPVEPGGYYDGGTGEPNDPYRIATPLHLWRIGMYPCDWDKHFILVADVNLASHDYDDKPFRTIGWRNDQGHPRLRPFDGVFDGNSHMISHFFWPSTSRRLYAGLFGWLGNAGKITNLRMDNVFIERHVVGANVGGLVGFSEGTIQSCRVTGEVGGNYTVGGLVGRNYGGKVSDCSSAAYIFGDRYVGGLVGLNKRNGKIHRSFVTGRVFARSDDIGDTGGLVGAMGEGEVIDCYARGDVEGDKKVGGLVGSCLGATIRRSYATGKVTGNVRIGGLIGKRQQCTTEACFWDIKTSGLDTSAGGTGLTTAEMQTANTFLETGWDFVDETVNGPNDIWKMWDGYDYPRLIWEPGPNTPLVFVDINDPGFYGQMSKYEVTNAQYCDFLNAALASGDITVNGNDVEGASGSNSGQDYLGQRYYRCDGSGYTGYGATNGGAARIHFSGGAFIVDSGFGNHPVTYVSWYGAMAFANYYGYYLPAEDQWQTVADYDGTYIYGCGETIDPGIANYRNSEHPDGTTPVGSFGIYGYGMSDMAGNVWEWTSSSLDSNRIFRGGSMGSIDSDCDVSIRGDGIPNANYWDIGFRVCR